MLFIALATLVVSVGTTLAQDSLRIIELSAPGQSAPVSIPAGYAFTFSLFSPESGKNDNEAAVGVVSYGSFQHEAKFELYYGMNTTYDGWYLGPAQVALRGSGAGARMQIYTIKLPRGVVSGILYEASQQHTVTVPKGSLLTPLLGFQTLPFSFAVDGYPERQFVNHLSLRSPTGAIYGASFINIGPGTARSSSPRIRGSASLHNPNSPASSVVNGLYYDDLDSVSPTADFLGPGTATFSLPPEAERSTPIAFYCYRITPANVIGADASPPSVKVTAPARASGATTFKSFLLKGSVTDNINPTSIRFRVKAPNASYGSWTSIALGGDQKTKSWQRSIGLSRKGIWYVQIQAFDGEKNVSTIQTVMLTRR